MNKTVAELHQYEERKITSFVWSRRKYEEAMTDEEVLFYWKRMLKAGYLVLKTREEKHFLLDQQYRPGVAVDALPMYYWRVLLGQQTYMTQSPFMEEIDNLLAVQEMGVDLESTGDPDRLARIKAAVKARKRKRAKKVSKDTARIVEEGKREAVREKINEFLHGGKPTVPEEYKVKRGMVICTEGDKITRVFKITKLPYIEPVEVNYWL